MTDFKEFKTKNKTDIQELTSRMMRLVELCQKLPPDTLRVLELHYLELRPLKEICTIMGKSMTVIRNHHDRGLFWLKQYYEEQGTGNR